MKIVYFTDVHFKGKNPEARIDNYPQSILKKLQYVMDYADKNADVILCGGDLVDTSNISDGMKNELMPILNNTTCPMYYCLGSHDYSDYNMNSLSRTTVKVLENANVFKILHSPVELVFADGLKVAFYATHHTTELDNSLEAYLLPTPLPEADYHIQMVHGMVVDKFLPFNHVLLEDLPVCGMGDVVLCGHVHPGFKPFEKDGHIILNPGSLGRKERTERIPQFIEIDITKEGISYKMVPIPCDMNVFSERKDYTNDIDREQRIKNFLDSLSDNTELTLHGDPVEVISKIAKDLGKSDKVISFLKEKLDKRESA